jgi:hypothetical protein
MILNHLHGLLNKSKEKNSIFFILLHINTQFPDLVEEGGYCSADGFGGWGLDSVVQIDHFTKLSRFESSIFIEAASAPDVLLPPSGSRDPTGSSCLAFSSPGVVGGCDEGGDPPLICLKMASRSVVAPVNDPVL